MGRFMTAIVLTVVASAYLVGPAPAIANNLPPGGSFFDDDGNVHEGMIEAIAARGLTKGCDPEGTMYCPSRLVTRAQMASFLARALGLDPIPGNRFADVSGVHEQNINAIAEAGITLGCNPSGVLYCPNDPVSRAQMGSFLARAFELAPLSGDRFADVSGVHEQNINAIAEAGITLGCNPSGALYCPNDPVRRDQMASFLGRALDLASTPPPSRFRFIFDEQTISPGVEGEIRREVGVVQVFLRRELGREVLGGAWIASASEDFLLQAFKDHFSIPAERNIQVGFPGAYPGAVFAFGYWRGTQLVAHEWFHLVQFQLANLPSQPPGAEANQGLLLGPIWLVEGSALYVQLWYSNDKGETDLDADRDFYIEIAKSETASLESAETRNGFNALTPPRHMISFLALDFLIAERGEQILVDYYEEIGRGASWEQSFESVFGRSLDTFYQEFEAYRRSGFVR